MSLTSLTAGVGTPNAHAGGDSVRVPNAPVGERVEGRRGARGAAEDDSSALPEGAVASMALSEPEPASVVASVEGEPVLDAPPRSLVVRSDSTDNLSDASLQIPGILRKGVPMLKVSAKKVQQRMVRIAPEEGRIRWESRKGGVSACFEMDRSLRRSSRLINGFLVNFENIRELRFGSSARHYRELFKISAASEPRWITIVFTTQGKYKLLHLVALSDPDFLLWRDTLVALFHLRRELMGGLDHMRKRHSVWLRQHWKMADESGDEKLAFEEVESLCRKLGIVASGQGLRKNFDEADVQKRGYLDFADFQVFVKLLKRRPEVERLMLVVAGGADAINLPQFVEFMRSTQKVSQIVFRTPYYKSDRLWAPCFSVKVTRRGARGHLFQIYRSRTTRHDTRGFQFFSHLLGQYRSRRKYDQARARHDPPLARVFHQQQSQCTSPLPFSPLLCWICRWLTR
jgi:hypothetical protein